VVVARADRTSEGAADDPGGPDGRVDVGEFIRHQREVARMSVRRLAELAGVSNPYLSQIERGLRRPSAEILQQIAKALHVSAEQLYVRAGILDPDSAMQMAVPDAISRDDRLTPEQKQSLLTIYESFVGSAGQPAAPR
jgi:transcriptional regulator with XRE-family HTH domain